MNRKNNAEYLRDLQNWYLSLVDSEIQDNLLRTLLLEFGESYIKKVDFDKRKVKYHVKREQLALLSSILEVIGKNASQVSDLDWGTYCISMHELLEKERVVNIRTNFKKFLYEFYLYVGNLGYLQGFKTYSHLLSYSDMRFKTKLDSRFNTNFPIDSEPQYILQIYLENQKDIAPYYANLNLKTDNPFIHTWLKEFAKNRREKFKQLPKSTPFSFYVRLFLYYFETSLGGLLPTSDSLTYFSEDLFINQFNFYIKFVEKYKDDEHSRLIITCLKSFYLIVDNKYREQNSKPLFDSISFNSQILSNKNYSHYLSLGYQFIIRVPHEPTPTNDKWAMIHDFKIKNANSYAGRTMNTIDFTQIEDQKLRDGLKNYIWIYKGSNDVAARTANVLIDLINSAIKNRENNIVPLRGEKILYSNQFVFNYRASLVLKGRKSLNHGGFSTSYINHVLIEIKKYLKHHRTIFPEVNELTLRQLKCIRKDSEEMEGNPFTPEDFKVLEKALREKKGLTEKLDFVIFQLSTNTKLRVGEITKLERNCVISKNEDLMIGKIRYIEKMSFGEYVEEFFLIEDINLIEEAMRLTEELATEAPEDLKNFIFLQRMETNGLYKDQIVLIGSGYSKRFSELCKENNLDYRAYNARHTFIDQTWQAVENGEMSDVEAMDITGHTTAQTARKHYRKYQTKRMLEAMYGVSIGDVDIDGNIIEREQIEELQQVEDSAGACSSDECIKVDIDDDDHICLTCKKFVTCPDRLPIFLERFKDNSKKRQEAKTEIERYYYQGLVDLYSAYLLALDEIRGES